MTAYDFFRAQLAPLIEHELAARGCRFMADIGCGEGYWLDYFGQFFQAGCQVYGVDLNRERLLAARERAPGAHLVNGDIRDLPWPDRSFELVSQFVVFSSVLVKADRERMAREMRRVLKPGGLILWWDFFAPNILNPQTKSIGRKEIATLFPDSRIMLRRVTLAPPLARISLRVSKRLAEMLDALPFVHTHYLGIIEPVGGTR